MTRTLVALASLVLVAAACASATRETRAPEPVVQAATAPAEVAVATAPAAARAPDERPAIVCRMERPLGSLIPEKVCRVVDLAEREREATQNWLQTLPRVQKN